MKRDKPIEESLYEDAARRRDYNQELKTKFDKIVDTPKEKKFVNEISDKYVIQRLDREIAHACDEIQGDQNSSDLKVLTYEQTGILLVRLGFIPETFSSESVESVLLSDLWKLLKGEELQGVSVNALRTVLVNIIGCKMSDKEKELDTTQKKNSPDRRESDEEHEEHESITDLGQYDPDGEFYLKKGEHSHFFMHFKNLYVNRMHYIGKNMSTIGNF